LINILFDNHSVKVNRRVVSGKETHRDRWICPERNTRARQHQHGRIRKVLIA